MLPSPLGQRLGPPKRRLTNGQKAHEQALSIRTQVKTTMRDYRTLSKMPKNIKTIENPKCYENMEQLEPSCITYGYKIVQSL